MYKEFQQPLLDQPGSTYKLFEGDINPRETYDRLFESGILPNQKQANPDIPAAHTPNNTLLVTGSLMWDPPGKGMGFDSIGRQLLALFNESAWNMQRYHRYGPVRSLLWMTEEDFKPAIPRSQYLHSKYSFVLNYLGNHVQVVTPGHLPKGSAKNSIGRLPQYQIQSVIRAMQRGKESGMELPAHRRENIHDFADEIARRNVEKGRDADTRLTTQEMRDFLDEQARAGISAAGIDWEQAMVAVQHQMEFEQDISRYTQTVGKSGRGIRSGHKLTPEGKEMNGRIALVRSSTKKRALCEKTADLGEALYNRECEFLAMEDGPEKEAAKVELDELNVDTVETIEKTRMSPYDPVSELNERLSMKAGLLQWDRRPYEPLVMQEDEVWPRKRACLVDSEPHPLPEGQSAGHFEWVLDFVVALFQNSTMSVKKALDGIQPGASAIAEAVPSLKDTKKGGRWYLEHMKPYMLTNEMLSDLTQAYRDWPFKSSHATHSKYFQTRVKGSVVPKEGRRKIT
ncbi:hypothetical protein GRF29_103g812052 [Pseudopithomyces chartarum]|uniref:Uncharacterized protein n=1 Tax=Pseudopithomyces chartarum TaxID=1892770 RepID=A0AAN6LV85_9PLEO|nr:hypothetical protein GRF29_103g812052 [Pseudopithomyces chartarum]